MCFICDRIKMINNGTNPYFVKELQTGYVVIGDNQHFKGYTLFLCKEHKTELFQLNHSKKIKFLEEMSIVAEAVSNAFRAEKMNYELLGNGDTHLHWHLFPRKSGDIENYGNNGKGPVWWYPMEKMYNDNNRPSKTELEDMKEKLLIELEKHNHKSIGRYILTVFFIQIIHLRLAALINKLFQCICFLAIYKKGVDECSITNL
jgi:diadenosine tetraphosphate (Ap4A) HIT family hydrolase